MTYKIVVTRYEGPDYKSKKAASDAMKKLRLKKHELAVVIKVVEES